MYRGGIVAAVQSVYPVPHPDKAKVICSPVVLCEVIKTDDRIFKPVVCG